MKAGDHILQICDVNVRGLASEQVAAVLRQSGSHVRLLVARPLEELPMGIEQLDENMYGSSVFAPIVPTRHLSQHINQLKAMISAYPDFVGFQGEGVLMEGGDYESEYNKNALVSQQQYTYQNAEHSRVNVDGLNDTNSMLYLTTTSPTTHNHDSDVFSNRPKTPKRLSLATVFEMSPLDTSDKITNEAEKNIKKNIEINKEKKIENNKENNVENNKIHERTEKNNDSSDDSKDNIRKDTDAQPKTEGIRLKIVSIIKINY